MRRYSRHYYVSDNLDELENIEKKLEDHDVTIKQIHVLSENEAELQHHEHLHAVPSIMKQDLIHSTEIGAAIGAIVAALVLFIVSLTSWTTTIGWAPFILLAIVLFGFCTWEGSFYGFQIPNKKFMRFEGELHKGKHIFFVDIESHQENVLDEILKDHPKLTPAGTESATSNWLLQMQCNWHEFRKEVP
ncbi:MAG: magnesium transporter [Bermanella sp.]